MSYKKKGLRGTEKELAEEVDEMSQEKGKF